MPTAREVAQSHIHSMQASLALLESFRASHVRYDALMKQSTADISDSQQLLEQLSQIVNAYQRNIISGRPTA